MSAAVALLPAAAVCIAVLALRWSGLAASGLAAGIAMALWLLHSIMGAALFVPASAAAGASGGATALATLGMAVTDALLLTLVVAAMILPGILFVEATGKRGSTAAVARLVGTLALPPAQAAILIAIGVGVLVESLTGMGVSLLVTMPLLLGLTERWRAIGLGLVGMSLMPWGALSISGLIGAKLAGLPIDTLSHAIWLVSAPVAFCLPLLCVGLVGRRTTPDLAIATLAGAVLVGGIGLASAFVGIEIAGVAGGLAVTVLMALVARRDTAWRAALTAPALRPYVALILAVVAQKAIVAHLQGRGLALDISTGRVSWAVLTSPGVALLAAAVSTVPRYLDAAAAAIAARRGWRPIASVALFMVSARILVEIGAIAALAGTVTDLGGTGAVIATAVLGAISGFITGSGITGNALFMPSAAAIGGSFGAVPLFAAVQNSAAGHTAMASLPVAAILLAALPGRTSGDDRTILRLGLALAAWHLAVLAGFAMARYVLGSP